MTGDEATAESPMPDGRQARTQPPAGHDSPPSDAPTVIEEPASPEDQRLVELLDRYVDGLHRRDVDACSLVLESHPRLAGLLRCLETLDTLAPDPPPGADFDAASPETGNADDAARSDGPTYVPGSGRRGEGAASSDLPRDFGKYELLEEIGRGGMGVVYLARQRDLDRLVAVKMILSSRLASPEEVRRFHAEAKTAGGLRHPHVVGIHEAGQIDGQHYFAMDYVEGECLSTLLRDGPPPLDEAARLMSTVARAVHHLHEHGIVHRDLKPGNILLDERGEPYVTDFGLAKAFAGDSHQTRTGLIIGTPSYMAPEQAAGRISQISPRSDVYSLGAVLYELLTGRPPFQHDNPLDTLVDVIEGEPTLPTRFRREIPRALEWICLRCLEKNPQSRYATAAEVADDLDRYRRGEPVLARPANPVQMIRRWGRREPALASRLLALFAAVVVLQTNYLVSGVDRAFHLKVMSILGAWGALCFGFQWLLNRDRWSDVARYAWSAADVVLLTAILWLADPPRGALLIGYPLLIAGSSMFFRVRLVVVMTGLCLASYAVLLWLHPDEIGRPHYPAIFATVLAVMGSLVGYQVWRLRVLSRCFESRGNE